MVVMEMVERERGVVVVGVIENCRIKLYGVEGVG
jgi:hypothetical protein